mgnify:FL=1
MKIGIYYKTKTEYHIETVNAFIDLLKQNDVGYEISENAKFGEINAIVVFGGDGTLLNVVGEAVEKDVPVYSVKCSDRGFLTSFNDKQLPELLQCILTEKAYKEVSLVSVQYKDEVYFGLNDIVIERVMGESELSNALRCNVYLNDKIVGNYIFDGAIVATPIGSTAYSLSAGGCILDDGLNAFVFTPINAHVCSNKSIVFKDTATLKICLTDRGNASLYIDGIKKQTLKNGDEITITKYVKSIKISDNYSNIYYKLRNEG